MGRNRNKVLLLRKLSSTSRQPIHHDVQLCAFVDSNLAIEEIGGASLPAILEAQVYVGNASNAPIAVDITGDVSIDADGITAIATSVVTGKALTGLDTTAGTVAEADSILQAIGKLTGNVLKLHKETTGQITQAEILALSGTPKELLPAPTAGYAYIIDEFQILHAYSNTAYATGSDLLLKYGGGGSIALIDKGLLTGVINVQSLIRPTIYDLDSTTGTSEGYDLATQSDKTIVLTVAGADFTNGAAGNKILYRLRYHEVAMLSSD